MRPLRWYTVPIELNLYHSDYLVTSCCNGSGKSTPVQDFSARLAARCGSRASTPGSVAILAAWRRIETGRGEIKM